MFIENAAFHRSLVDKLLSEPVDATPGNLDHVVRQMLLRRDDLLALAAREETPCYVFDEASFAAILDEFAMAFAAHVPRHRSFYAIKSNHHPLVFGAAVAGGFGLDVSSSRELRLALETSAPRILFSGPAKSTADLQLAAAHADRVIVNIDSFRELQLLGEVTASAAQPIRAGVRIHTGLHGTWSKFGIPLAELPRFWRAASAHRGLALQGIQSHLSWTHDGTPHAGVIAAVANCLRNEFSPAECDAIRYYDFGGGYRPHQIEGRYPAETPQGELLKLAAEHFGARCRFETPYFEQNSVPLVDYAQVIGAAIGEHLEPLLGGNCEYFSEPGRVVASRAMHYLLRVVDKKRDDLVIVDGGIHMIGWERYLHVYVPIINLTRPALADLPLRVCGSLCDPEDIFGFHVRAAAIEPGDVLLMPYQGAYSYSTAQNFIRDIPPVHMLAARSASRSSTR